MTGHPRPPLARTAIAPLLACIALVGVGCNGDASDAVADSATSARRPQAAVDGAPAATLISDAARRAQDATSLTVRTTTTAGTSAPSVVTTRSNADGSQLSVVADLPGTGEVEARRVDGTIFVQVPGLAGGADWVSFDADMATGPLAGQLDRFVDDDPRLPFGALTEVSSDVVEIERSTVEGVPVTRYRVTVDAAGLFGPDAPPGLTGATDVDVWVDDEGSMRQLRYELDGAVVDMPSTTLVIESTVISSDEPVRVDPPPSDATVPFDQLLASGDLAGLAEALGGN